MRTIPKPVLILAMSRLLWSLRTGFIWPGMSADVTKHVNACPSSCQARLKKQRRTRHLKHFSPSAPLEQVAIDILGPLPKTNRSHQYVLVVTDQYLKLTRAAPLRDVTAHEVAATFIDLWVASYGIPVFLLSDNGSQFTSKLLQRVAQIMGYHSSSHQHITPRRMGKLNGSTQQHSTS
jgi:Integrase core domain